MKHRIIQGIVTALAVLGLLTMVSCAQKEVTASAETVEMSPPPLAEEKAVEPEKAAAPEASESADARAITETKTGEEEKEQARREQDKERFFTQHIHFAFDSAELDATAQALAREKAAWLDESPNIAVRIEGHCDQTGAETYNMALGKRRASAVKSYLVALGLPEDRLMDVSLGETAPIAREADEAAYQLNRRVQFKLQPPAQ